MLTHQHEFASKGFLCMEVLNGTNQHHNKAVNYVKFIREFAEIEVS